MICISTVNQNVVGDGFESSSHLQTKADDVSNMRDDDGHFTFYELIKHLHCLTGLVLFKRESCKHNILERSLTQSSQTFASADLIRSDEVLQGNDQIGNETSHQVLLPEQ